MRAKNVITVVCLLLTGAMFAQKRNITEKDIFDFTWIGDTQLSPDGSCCLCANDSGCGARLRYGYAGYGPADDTAPAADKWAMTRNRWSPDGTQLAFARRRRTASHIGSALCTFTGRGEPVQVSSWRKSRLAASGLDGTCIAVLARRRLCLSETEKKKEGAGGGTQAGEHKSDVRSLRRRCIATTVRVYRYEGRFAALPALYTARWIKPVTAWRLLLDGFGRRIAWDPSSRAKSITRQTCREPYYDLPHNEIYAGDSAEGPTKDEKAPPPLSTLVSKLT